MNEIPELPQPPLMVDLPPRPPTPKTWPIRFTAQAANFAFFGVLMSVCLWLVFVEIPAIRRQVVDDAAQRLSGLHEEYRNDRLRDVEQTPNNDARMLENQWLIIENQQAIIALHKQTLKKVAEVKEKPK